MPAPVKMRDTRVKPRGLTPEVKQMIELMVHQGRKRDEAAKHVGLTDRAGRAAMRKPEVLAAYNAELEVLRESQRALNILALTEVRDQTGNQMARVNAVKALEQLSEEAGRPGNGRPRDVQPGFVIIVAGNQPQPTVLPRASAAPVLDHVPTEQFDPNEVLWTDGRDERAG